VRERGAPGEQAEKKNETGQPRLWAGVAAAKKIKKKGGVQKKKKKKKRTPPH
jgi:hypothetical protein